jgi:hypothetical protein
MTRRTLFSLVAVFALGVLPARANDPIQDFSHAADRFLPGEVGEEKPFTFVFGPFAVPAGQDNNKILLDLPVQTGFITEVRPNLINARDGTEPSLQTAHIHHAHWFRVTNEGQYEYYTAPIGGVAGLSWVFGTGEERTQGSLDDRAALERTPQRNLHYGIEVQGDTPQALIFMIHNKTSAQLVAYITLKVTFIYGSQAELAAKGIEMHPLRGVLWGRTTDVLAGTKGVLEPRTYTPSYDGTLIASGGHMHQGGRLVYVVNLGQNGECADLDADRDGVPGVTLYRSDKMDRVAESAPYSEEYLMGATQFGFRAPIRKGDQLMQYGVYDVGQPANQDYFGKLTTDEPGHFGRYALGVAAGSPDRHSWYDAMSYVGLYLDELQKPAAVTGGTAAERCALGLYAPRLLNDPAGDPTATIPTRPFNTTSDVCGVGGYPACDRGAADMAGWTRGQWTNQIHVGGFVYAPGDLAHIGTTGIPYVVRGEKVQLVNEDLAVGVRHTFTSCSLPCTGKYVANYPLPNGDFQSGKLGNLDYIDGGLDGDDTLPTYELDTAGLTPGFHAYYCEIHPWMRGALEVVAA